MKNSNIEKIKGLQVFDSRGNPTVMAIVKLNDGTIAKAMSPSGASTGSFEAYEKRDGGKDYMGKGVLKAVTVVDNQINELLNGVDCQNQKHIDSLLINADKTENKSNYGANAILAVSLACAKAAAIHKGIPLYRHIGGITANRLPIPMMNILNGGAHAGNNIDIQEFMIRPTGAKSFTDAMRMSCEVYHNLKSLLKKDGLETTVGDEGGFAPNLQSDEKALEYILKAIEKAGYKPGDQISIALDAAATEWVKDNGYVLPKRKTKFTSDELVNYFEKLCEKYPITSIEDPLGEEDFDGFKKITEKLCGKVQIVGDDLFVTNTKRLEKGIENGSANSILIKPNQIGTLSETMEAVRLAKQNNFTTIISHRSGETEDSTIADIAVGLNAGQIKTGAPARSERVAKYNRLLEIENQLSQNAIYG